MIVQRIKELEVGTRTDASSLDPEELLGYIGIEDWIVRLHLCRLVSRVAWSNKQLKIVEPFLFDQARCDNAFVRAWAVDALASVACTDATIRPQVLELIERALEEDRPSVRVRAREGLKRLSLLAERPEA